MSTVETGSPAPGLARSQPAAMPRFDVLGVHVSAASMDAAVDQISQWIEDDARAYVCVTDVNGVVRASADATLLGVYNGSDMTLPDGMPLVWSGRRAGFAQMTRVCGPDLMPIMLAEAARRGWSSYFYGGAPGVAQRMVQRLGEQIDGLLVAGVAAPPFRPLTAAETARDMAAINASGADLVWVGLGAPKQEKWMADHRELLAAHVLLGVGAAFAIHAGEVRRAPMWMQRHGLEWMYRLKQEPRRLWRRYFVAIPRFAWGVLRTSPRPTSATASPLVTSGRDRATDGRALGH